MAQVTINNGDSGSTVRGALNGMFTELYGESNFPQVATYADLPVASSFSGATYEVTTSTGTFLVNRKSAGLYRSNGTTWIYLGDINTDAATTGNTPAGNISATTVQAAINELDTEKAIAGAVTSSGLTMATGKLLGRSTASTGAIEELSTVPAANFPALTGDITTAGGALATTIANSAVTLAKMANMATASLIYRKTAGSGAPEVNTLATLKTDLGLTGTNSGDQTITLTGNVTGSGTGSFATTIAASAVTLAMQADMATASLVYRKTAGAGAPEVNTLATLKTDLGLTGTNSGDQTITLTGDVTGSGTGSFAATLASNQKIRTITFIVDGSGQVISTGLKGFIEIPFACTINRVTVMCDQSGSIVFDIWKDTYANYPPTVADTITASAKPTVSSATKSQDATLTGWTTSISAGDILGFNVDSVTTCQRVTISLKVTAT